MIYDDESRIISIDYKEEHEKDGQIDEQQSKTVTLEFDYK